MSSRAVANRVTLWIIVAVGLLLFTGSILFIASRAH
jgi:hypothetical protein